MRNELMIDIKTTGQRVGCKVLSQTFSITHPDFNNAVTLITAELIRNGEIVSIINTQRS